MAGLWRCRRLLLRLGRGLCAFSEVYRTSEMAHQWNHIGVGTPICGSDCSLFETVDNGNNLDDGRVKVAASNRK